MDFYFFFSNCDIFRINIFIWFWNLIKFNQIFRRNDCRLHFSLFHCPILLRNRHGLIMKSVYSQIFFYLLSKNIYILSTARFFQRDYIKFITSGEKWLVQLRVLTIREHLFDKHSTFYILHFIKFYCGLLINRTIGRNSEVMAIVITGNVPVLFPLLLL